MDLGRKVAEELEDRGTDPIEPTYVKTWPTSEPLSSRVARRFLARDQYFELQDLVTYGKYKNHKGRIVGFGKDKWGNPTVEIEPIPKGRKQNKIFGLFKIWRADVKEKALAEQAAQAESLTARVAARYAALESLPVDRNKIKGLDPTDTDNDWGWQYPIGFLDMGPL